MEHSGAKHELFKNEADAKVYLDWELGGKQPHPCPHRQNCRFLGLDNAGHQVFQKYFAQILTTRFVGRIARGFGSIDCRTINKMDLFFSIFCHYNMLEFFDKWSGLLAGNFVNGQFYEWPIFKKWKWFTSSQVFREKTRISLVHDLVSIFHWHDNLLALQCHQSRDKFQI